MRLYLINPSNPLVSIVNVRESRWNRYRVWKPLGLMVLAGLTPPGWDIRIFDENLGAPDYRNNFRLDCKAYLDFTRQRRHAFQHKSNATSQPCLNDYENHPSLYQP